MNADKDHREFVPFVLTTYGAMGDAAQQLLTDIANHPSHVMSPQCLRWSHTEIFDTVSCTLQRGNAEILALGNVSMASGQSFSIRTVPNSGGVRTRRVVKRRYASSPPAPANSPPSLADRMIAH